MGCDFCVVEKFSKMKFFEEIFVRKVAYNVYLFVSLHYQRNEPARRAFLTQIAPYFGTFYLLTDNFLHINIQLSIYPSFLWYKRY